jgi:hypothetical protein
VLEVSDDPFGGDHEFTSDTHSPGALEEAWLKAKRIAQDIRTHLHAWGKIGEEMRTRSPQTPPDDMGFGESNVHDLDGSESDSKPPPLAAHHLNQLSGSDDSSRLHDSDDSDVKEESDEATVAQCGWRRHSNELWIPARPQSIAPQAVHCLNQLPETASESAVEEGRPTGVVANGTAPESSEEEDSDVILAARRGWDQVSDGTSSQCSRRSEDTENPHWSPSWGGLGIHGSTPGSQGCTP